MFSILNRDFRLRSLIQFLSVLASLIYLQIGYALVIPTNTGQLEAITIRSVDGNWQLVALENTYVSPVVVCTHNIAAASDNPAVVRIRNTGATSFELRLQEPRDSTDVTAADVYCLVAEEGENQLTDGRDFEARTVISDDVAGSGIPGSDWNGRGEDVSAALTNTYTNAVVLGQVMSFNDPNFSIFWSYDCELRQNPPFQSGFADGICVGKHIGEDSVQTRADETLGYFVIEAGAGQLPIGLDTIEYETALGPDIIFGVQGPPGTPPHNYVLPQTYNFGVATQEAMDGINGGFAVLFGPNPFAFNRLGLAVDEDQIRDAERAHTSEQAGFWVFKESDYGDAPDSYSTLDGSGGPEHLIQSGFSVDTQDDIFIGISSTSETDGVPAAEGDPANGDVDDGGIVFPLTPLGFSAGDMYTVNVPYTGNARLCGWIDFDYNGQGGDGTFETDERSCIDTLACPGGGVAGACDLVFTAPADFVHNNNQITYARFRIGPNAAEVESPTGLAFGGEVEDYEIPANTLPVTLNHISSVRNGNTVDIDWGTSSELFNVGFQLWGLDGVDGQWEKLHNWLIRSGSGNAVEPQSYTKRIRIPTSIDQLVSVGISSVDSDGTEHYYGPFELGVSYGELGDLAPIAWDDVRAELDTRMAAQGYTKSGVNGYRKASSTSTLALSSTDSDSVIEFRVSTPGVYRITGSELPQEWHSAPKEALAVLDYQGNGVVRHVQAKGQGSGSTRALGAAGSIYFYSEGVNETQRLYSEAKVYRLVLDSARALNAPIQSKQGVTSGFSDSYREVSIVEEDESYIFHSAVDDPWLDEVVIGFSDKLRVRRQPVPVEGDLLIDDSATLLLGLGRSSALGAIDLDSDGVQDAEHIVTGTVTDADGVKVKLDPVSAVGSGRWDLALPIPAGTLLGDANGIVHSGAFFNAGEGYAFSEVHIDSIGLEYSRPYVSKAGEDHLLFRGPDTGELGYSVTVPDTGWPWVFASDGSNLVRIGLESQRRVTDSAGVKWREVTFSRLLGSELSPLSIQYWVSGRNGFYGVEGLVDKVVPSQASVLAQAQGSDYVMVSHPMFMGPAQAGVDPLSTYAEFKQGQGYTASMINYLDIVESFGGGQVGPWGLTHYLSELKLQSPLLKYVLLVGSSVYDHSDKLGTGALTFIPGHYVPGSHSDYTVSDVPYITHGDGALFAHIGRWPVRELSELQVIVDKSMQWGSAAHHQGEALLIAEHTVLGEEINFAQALDGVADVLPATYSHHKVYVDALLAADPDLSLTQALALAKGQIIDALNNGPEVVVYNGHASTGQLSNQNLFKHKDVSKVTSSGAEIWVPLSCYVTYYESTTVNTLAHQLLFTGNAVAITGAMLLSNQAENIQMGQSILDSTFNQGQSIGEAVNQAKTIQNNPNLTHNWATLGDPSAKF